MSSIPFKAFKFGALSLFKEKVSYGKSRVAGSKKVSYLLCSKAGLMPGQPEIFNPTRFSDPFSENSLYMNSMISDYKLNQKYSINKVKGSKYQRSNEDDFTYDNYSPHDDETYRLAINASYKQVYGNFNLMHSERSVDLERRLRNGDITIKEFIRGIAKSNLYKRLYFESVSQQRSIELNFIHLLGRPPLNQQEIIKHIELIHEYGIEKHIDNLIDSDEYNEIFGKYIVPYNRCWNSPCGITTASFINSSILKRGFAVSDNVLNMTFFNPIKGASLIFKNLSHNGHVEQIKLPSIVK